MHFRNFILSLIAGTAFFFPTDALAEKNELAQGDKVGKEVSTPQNIEQSKENESVPISSPVSIEEVSNQHPTSNTHSQQAESSLPAQKAVQSPDKASNNVQSAIQLPEQANEKAQSSGKSEAEKAVKNTLPVKSAKVEINQGQKEGQIKNQKLQSTNKESYSKTNKAGKHSEEPSEKSLHTIGTGEKPTDQYTKKVQKLDYENLYQPILNKKDVSEKTSSDESKSKKAEKIPSRQDRYPEDIMGMNSPQNTKSSGSSSKDRTGHGQSTSNSVEKWIEFEKRWNLKLVQPHVSKAHVFRNQWVNAPPSPPPKAAPFFLTYTISKHYG
ncbi:MAG: hypothetical protein ACQEWV_21170 [Bacillota bacterium]